MPFHSNPSVLSATASKTYQLAKAAQHQRFSTAPRATGTGTNKNYNNSTVGGRSRVASKHSSGNTEGKPRSSVGTALLSASVAGVGCALLRQSTGRSAPVHNCGIVGYVGQKEAEPVLSDGVQLLQNRGYDSCGIATINSKGNIVTTKFASRGSTSDCIDMLVRDAPKNHKGHNIGIAHTRWATHGSKIDVNAHPHSDWRGVLSLVHNGTIENYSVLKERLMAQGATFQSQTDTEVIANLISSYMQDGQSFEESVQSAVGELQGTWGLVVMHKDHPDRLVLARNGSPLLVGFSDNQIFVASEPLALASHANQFLPLKDREIISVSAEGIAHLCATRELQKIEIDKVELSPDPFKHWTLKEIYEQPQSLARAVNYGGRVSVSPRKVMLGGLERNKENYSNVKDLLISGCGTSLYAAMYGELLMQHLGSVESVKAIDASEVEQHSFPKDNPASCLLLISQSGETLDVIKTCQLADTLGVRKMSIVNAVGSLLARMTNCGVYLNAGREVAVASTKAFTSQVTVLSLIASWFAQTKSEFPDRLDSLIQAIHRLPIYAGVAMQCHEQCERIAKSIKDSRSLFVLGKGFAYPVALEGALKIKELSYVHAEGFAGGALKHGPFALIDEKERTPVILLVLNDEHAPLMINAAEQVKARGARLICITDEPNLVKGVADETITIPSNGPLTALLAVVPLQLLGYSLATAKGINPDKPRGLAKTVTVH